MSIFEIHVENTLHDYAINENRLKRLVDYVLSHEKLRKAFISIVLIDDKLITKMNKHYLKKESTTDVLSFELEKDREKKYIEGEIYANLNQIERQSKIYQVTFDDELFRVVIHGVLHLLDYDDKTEEDYKIMKQREDYYLSKA